MPRSILLLLLVLLLAGCGGAQVRPIVAATTPSFGDVVSDPVPYVHIWFDMPVTILNPAQLNVKLDGVDIPMWIEVDPTQTNLVVITPQSGIPLGPGTVTVAVAQGLVVNAEEHYSLEDYQFGFLVNPPPTKATLDALPAKPAANVVAVQPPPSSGAPLVWLQLAHGGSTGEALLLWDRLEGTLTTVPLTFRAGGGLTARHPALAIAPDGSFVYVAYRDEAAARVRVCRVDARTAVEVDARLLSATASSSLSPLAPLALTFIEGGMRLRVYVESNAGRSALELDAATLEEVPLSGF
jgi:hypothetical protein